MKKYCSQCGKDGAPTGRFCADCGYQFGMRPIGNVPQVKKKRKINWIGLSVLTVIALFLGVFYINKRLTDQIEAERREHLFRTTYIEPEIGMFFDKFDNLCNTGVAYDGFFSIENITTVTIEYSEKSNMKKCVEIVKQIV